jgi:hypothetical protein
MANVIYLSTALAMASSAPTMCSSATPKNVKAAKLIATKARVDRTTTNARFCGDRQARHQINATIRTRTEAGTETEATIDSSENTFRASMKMQCVGCSNVVT